MNLSDLTYRFCFKQIDETAVTNFLMTQQQELLLENRAAAQKVTNLLFENGGILAGFDPQNEIVGMLGFFFGDPADGYTDKEILFFYVAAIAKPYRMSRLFYMGMLMIMNKGKEMKLDRFKMQANIHDPYINRLYGRMAQPLGQSKTLRGHPVMTYGGTISDLLARYDPHYQKTAARPTNHLSHARFFAKN